MDFLLYFQILLGQWQGVILEIHMGVLEFLVPFYPINTALVIFSSDLKMDPLNLYPTLRPILSSSCDVRLSVCLSVCLCVCPLPMQFFSRPLIGPQVT